ncbi:lantibiotic dehydratase [Chitinophaga vietnamensis]|uniref:lantibiotic dehydratase n=1 Tax=Chitinophaga vietnamensis TaxID=2593957 RepID=UPI001178BDD6|nr:lantibiotic dehydratase [Chitinophaga vietnamensis]
MTIAEDFYLIRTPLLPFNFLDRFNNLPHAALAATLKQLLTDPYLQEAIYIASPELHQELLKWLEGIPFSPREEDKLTSALFRYLLRMSSRSTPYGLFAGCATGAFGSHTAVQLQERNLHKKHSRLDMNYVAELAATITATPTIREQLTWYPNSSLYKMGSTWRYAAYTIKDKYRHYYLTSVNATEYLEIILLKAASGATLEALSQSIVADDITPEEARDFVQELVDSQLLVSALEPTVTGEEFFSYFSRQLANIPGSENFTHSLQRIHELLQDPAHGTAKYITAHQLVKSILPETSNKDLIQTDLFLQTHTNTISSAAIKDITQQVDQLWKLSLPNQNNDLQDFMQRFRERFEEQEVPLAVALDSESGIGYASHSGGRGDHTPLVDDIITPGNATTDSMPRSKMQAFQLQELQRCLKEHRKEIILTDEHLEALKHKDPPTPPYSTYLMGSLLANSAAAIDAGDYLFSLNGCSGPSAANLLGRFCHGDDTLTQKVMDALRSEEASDPDAIFAEIVHLPEARTGNILMRPRLRPYEIVYLSNSSTPASHQIPLSDLLVSVRQNKIVLRSKKLNKIIIPRLSTAHNFRNGLLAYRFLCDLQSQGLSGPVIWQWQLPAEASFLPRVVYKKILLSKCTWILQKKDYPELLQKQTTDYVALFTRIRQQLDLPRYVVIAEGDNELLIDLDNASCIHLLATNLIKKEKLTLEEFTFGEGQCWVEGPDGLHVHELIIPLKQSVAAAAHTPSILTPPAQMPRRQFIPGSEWLYVKIYCGTTSAESILKQALRPLTTELMEAGIIDQWFFLRYGDPDNHIRIRFHHGSNKDFWKATLDALYSCLQPLADQGLSYRIQTDTYEREIERYGADTMLFSESVFHYDSESVISFLDLLDGEEGEQYRWLLAARGIDMLLRDFGYDLPAKSKLLQLLQKNFFEEFGGGKPLHNQLNDKYRAEMRRIASIMDPSQDEANGIEEAIALFTIRSQRIQSAIDAHSGNKLLLRNDLLSSYIHMFLNRMIVSNQRKHELVIYHFLQKYYDSQLAIAKKAKVV